MIAARLKKAFDKCAWMNENRNAKYSIPLEQALAKVVEALEEICGGHDSRCSYDELGCHQCIAYKSLKELNERLKECGV